MKKLMRLIILLTSIAFIMNFTSACILIIRRDSVAWLVLISAFLCVPSVIVGLRSKD